MNDETEEIRKDLIVAINSAPGIREQLEADYGVGNVWSTSELGIEFEVMGFMAPFCVVRRKKDRIVGTVMFQNDPRFYFSFEPDSDLAPPEHRERGDEV